MEDWYASLCEGACRGRGMEDWYALLFEERGGGRSMRGGVTWEYLGKVVSLKDGI